MAAYQKTAALNPAALIAARQRRTAFVPEVDGFLIVLLPGESMRCPVRKVFDDNTVIVELDKPPISKMHTFAMNDHVGVRRRIDNQGREIWEAQRDRDFLQEQKRITEMARPTPAPPPPQPKAAPHVKVAPPVKAPVKAKARVNAKIQAKNPVKRKPATKAPAKRKATRR